MAIAETIKDNQMRFMNLVHRAVLTASGGRIGTSIGSMPVYKVTTTGRKSGQPRTIMLTAPVTDEDTYVFVASKGGDDRDPDWYRNLVANPEIQVAPADGGPMVDLVARTASADEKAELWPRIVEAYKGYEGYQKGTERDIPVVIAEPAST
ncbi:MAG: nitroreductase family deazaflavin-dependent oxidoreductase [Actinomycetota bacterium]